MSWGTRPLRFFGVLGVSAQTGNARLTYIIPKNLKLIPKLFVTTWIAHTKVAKVLTFGAIEVDTLGRMDASFFPCGSEDIDLS